MITQSKRLLILACSQRKRSDPDLLPAIERYNGPIFQVLHKFQRDNPVEAQSFDSYILSAKFGLIPSDKQISNYDFKMTSKRAQELQSGVLQDFRRLLQDNYYNKLFISLGRNYLQAFAGYEEIIPTNLKAIVSQGSQGRRQTELRDWLYQDLPDQSVHQTAPIPHGKARIRGIEINLTKDQIFELARTQLSDGHDKATNYQSWYVKIDDQRVAPKWLVSQLTGLSVGSFHTGDARRVLQQLGIEARRT